MKTVSKKLLSLLLVAFLLVSALPFQAFATENEGDPSVAGTSVVDPTTLEGPGISDLENPGTPVDISETDEVEPVVDPSPVVEPGPSPEPGPVVEPGPSPEPGPSGIAHTNEHRLLFQQLEGGQHKTVCSVAGCDYTPVTEACHEFDYSNQSHRCIECNAIYNDGALGHDWVPDTSTAVEPTCQHDGKEADRECSLCHKREVGATLAKIAHTPDANGVCTMCQLVVDPQYIDVVFHIGAGHKFDGQGSDVLTISKRWAKGSSAYDLPKVAADKKYNFLGWFTAETGGTQLDTTNAFQMAAEAVKDTNSATFHLYAHWADVTYPITVYRILNKDVKTAKNIGTVNAAPDTLISMAIQASGYLGHTEPGYKIVLGGGADFPIMKYVGGNFVPVGSSDYAIGGFDVYLNMVPCTYTLFLNPNNGIVTPDKLTDVAYNGEIVLPTPKKDGSVFMGWEDVNHEIHPAGKMVYNFQQDTTFTALWSDELTVMLKVYINGDTTSAPRIYPLSQLVKDSKVFRSDVEGIISSNYVSSGGNMVVYGLYSDKTWNNGSISVDGNPFVEVVKENGVNYIYVMLMNAAPIGTVVTGPTNGAYWISTGNGTGYWVTPNFNTVNPYIYSNGLNGAYWVSTGNSGYWVYPGNIILNGSTNPKTGDTAMIEIAAAVMILAAAALVVSMSLRKKAN